MVRGRRGSRPASRSSARARRRRRRASTGTPCRARRVVGDRRAAAREYTSLMSGNRGAEAIVVRADERIAAEQVDVIVDDHQRALREAGVDAAGGVGQDDLLHAEPRPSRASAKTTCEVVALVEVGAPASAATRCARHGADDQPPGVADDLRRGPMRQSAYGVATASSSVSAKSPRPEPRTMAISGSAPQRGADCGGRLLALDRRSSRRASRRRELHRLSRQHPRDASPSGSSRTSRPASRAARAAPGRAAARAPARRCRRSGCRSS